MKKTLFLAYGILVYIISIGTFLYAIGFISSVVVPKTLDSPPVEPLGYALVNNISLVILFAFQKLMIRTSLRKWWELHVSSVVQRTTSALLSCLFLMLVLIQWQPTGGTIWKIDCETGKNIL